MRSCRTIVDQFLYRACVDRKSSRPNKEYLSSIDDLSEVVDDLAERVRTIEGMLGELSSEGYTGDNALVIQLVSELDDARDEYDVALRRLKELSI